MTDFEMLSMFPGLMLAGHETTSNLLCMALGHLLADRDLYAAAQRDDASRAALLEEMFRFESAITGMRRQVTEDTVLGGVSLHAGEQVFLAYAAGSRDPRRFDGLRRDRSRPRLVVPAPRLRSGRARVPWRTAGPAPAERRARRAAGAAARPAIADPSAAWARHRGGRGPWRELVPGAVEAHVPPRRGAPARRRRRLARDQRRHGATAGDPVGRRTHAGGGGPPGVGARRPCGLAPARRAGASVLPLRPGRRRVLAGRRASRARGPGRVRRCPRPRRRGPVGVDGPRNHFRVRPARPCASSPAGSGSRRCSR